MRSSMSWRKMSWRKRVFLLLAASVAVSIAGVIAFDGGLENVSAELAGALLAVVLTVTIVEWLLKDLRVEQWKRVRGQTLNAIQTRIEQIGGEFASYAPAEETLDYVEVMVKEQPERHHLRALRGLHRAIETNIANLSTGVGVPAEHSPEDEYQVEAQASSQPLEEAVRPHVQALEETLTPRVLELDQQPELAGRLMELEKAAWLWNRKVQPVHNPGLRDVNISRWTAAAQFLNSAICVFELASEESRIQSSRGKAASGLDP
jgi:hypothetical protein